MPRSRSPFLRVSACPEMILFLHLPECRADGMADVRDLKSRGDFPRVGSTPTPGTTCPYHKNIINRGDSELSGALARGDLQNSPRLALRLWWLFDGGERIDGAPQMPRRKVRVLHGLLNRGVAEELLNLRDQHALHRQERSERMPQIVRKKSVISGYISPSPRESPASKPKYPKPSKHRFETSCQCKLS